MKKYTTTELLMRAKKEKVSLMCCFTYLMLIVPIILSNFANSEVECVWKYTQKWWALIRWCAFEKLNNKRIVRQSVVTYCVRLDLNMWMVINRWIGWIVRLVSWKSNQSSITHTQFCAIRIFKFKFRKMCNHLTISYLQFGNTFEKTRKNPKKTYKKKIEKYPLA